MFYRFILKHFRTLQQNDDEFRQQIEAGFQELRSQIDDIPEAIARNLNASGDGSPTPEATQFLTHVLEQFDSLKELLALSDADRHEIADELRCISAQLESIAATGATVDERTELILATVLETKRVLTKSGEREVGYTPGPLPPPARPAVCVGRDELIEAAVQAMLASPPRPLPVLGTMGIGKSSIVLAALHDDRVIRKFRRNRVFVRCDAVSDVQSLAGLIAEHLGLKQVSDAVNAVTDWLQRQECALVLDNLETVWSSDKSNVEDLLGRLSSVPELSLTVTMRGPVPPAQPGNWTEPVEPPQLSDADAQTAFLGHTRGRFADDPMLSELVSEMEGVPLALFLLARASLLQGTLSLELIRDRWRAERTRLLNRDSESQRETVEHRREVDIEASFQVSLAISNMMDKKAVEVRKCLAVLGLLPDGSSLTDLRTICGSNYASCVAKLYACGLVFQDRPDRTRMLAPLRECVLGYRKLKPAVRAVSRRVVSHFFSLAEELGDLAGRDGGAEAVLRLSADAANIEYLMRQEVASRSDRSSREQVDGVTELFNAADAFSEFMAFSGFGSASLLLELCGLSDVVG
ncbi:MAG: nSTAND1 domain-containing NTPase, partial [Planctomycetota bacterium]